MPSIEQQRSKVANLAKKLARMSPMVPPPIRAEVAMRHAKECSILDKMESAARAPLSDPYDLSGY